MASPRVTVYRACHGSGWGIDSMTRPLLIAETDGDGAVSWVWWSARDGMPRPIATGAALGLDPDRAEIHGADRASVLVWLRRHGCLRSAGEGPERVSALPLRTAG